MQLTAFDFPGNVRQLENICHWLTVMAPAQVIEPKDLPPEVMVNGHAGAALAAAATVASAPGAPAAPPAAGGLPSAVPPAAPDLIGAAWLTDLEREARLLLERGQAEVWDHLTRQFEGRLILTALSLTKGRRIEAAHKLGIGRNTITRKIQELGLDD